MSSATPAPLSTRDLLKRYRAPLITAVPAGVVLGMIADLALSFDTVHVPAQDLLPALLAYACLGAGFALVACVGAVVAVLVSRPRATTPTPFWRIAAGAGGAVFIGVLVAGAVSSSWAWYPFVVVVALVTALVAGAVAGAITAVFQFRRRLLP